MNLQPDQLWIEDAGDLRDWLEENYDREDSIWVVRWKKKEGRPYVTYDEIVDECICFGWVDSLPKKLDDERTMLRISPRNPKSNWSGKNKERVAELTKQGKMHTSGLEMVELAKESGTWDFLDDVEKLIVPPDLQKALETTLEAEHYFDRFPPSSKRGILEWIKTAKTEPTRNKRIQETAEKASRNIKANHPKGRDAGPA